MKICNRENFTMQCGRPFRIRVNAAQEVELTLRSVTALPSVPSPEETPAREAFSVLFSGPTTFVLPQRIYTIHNAELGAIDIFIAPIGRTEAELQYQAVFN
jgi:hypothetical protein